MGLLVSNYSANPVTNNSVQINAVSGTLAKTFRDSFFVRFHMKSELAESYLGVESYRLVAVSKYNNEKVPTVVLQTMLCEDNQFLCEIIDKEKYDLMFTGEVKNV